MAHRDRREYQRAHYQKNRERVIARSVEWAKKNPGRRRGISLKWSRENPDKKKQAQVKYRKEQPIKYLVSIARRRAKKRGTDFNITADDLVLPSVCPLLGITIDSFSDDVDKRPSLDRIDNKRGYVQGNVLVVSHRANRIKADATYAELRRMADNLERILV